MTNRRLAEPHLQPKEFSFTAENRAWAEKQLTKYPQGRQASAVIPLLWRAQEQAGGWLPQKAIEHVAEVLGMARIRVLEVATFYTMFNLAPVGRFHVQVCGTTPCMLRGSDDVLRACELRGLRKSPGFALVATTSQNDIARSTVHISSRYDSTAPAMHDALCAEGTRSHSCATRRCSSHHPEPCLPTPK